MRTMVAMWLFVLLLVVLPLRQTSTYAVTLAVPGVDLPQTLSPGDVFHPNKDPEYLGEAIDSFYKERSSSFKEEVIAFTDWKDRDPAGTENAVKQLKKRILEAYKKAQDEGTSFNIVAHSWGGVLTYRALKELGDRVKVDNLVTLGTPLNYVSDVVLRRIIKERDDALKKKGADKVKIALETSKKIEAYCKTWHYSVGDCDIAVWAAALTWRRSGISTINKLKSVKNWKNYWSPGDPLSRPIGPAQNVELPEIGGPWDDHAQYYAWNYGGSQVAVAGDVARVRWTAERVLSEIAVAIVRSNREKQAEKEKYARVQKQVGEAKNCPETKVTESASKTYQEWKQSIEKHIPVGKRIGC